MKFLTGLSSLPSHYSHIIFDIWGVLHDGIKTYPDAIETILSLKKLGKKICLLSNAPRRCFKVSQILEQLGITENLYDFILTSGEATFLNMKQNQEEGFKNFGKNYFYIGPQKDIDLLDGLDYTRVSKAAEANFALVTGFEEKSSLEDKIPQAIEAKKYNLPMICTNPDLVAIRQNGEEIVCAGALANEYQKIGGKVIYYGKPYSAVYEMVHKLFDNVEKEKIIAIGDGIETDIKGANNFKIDNVLITGGILTKPLGIKFWQDANEKKLTAICKNQQIFPKFVISNLKL